MEVELLEVLQQTGLDLPRQPAQQRAFVCVVPRQFLVRDAVRAADHDAFQAVVAVKVRLHDVESGQANGMSHLGPAKH